MTVPNLRQLRDIDPPPTEGDSADLAPAESAVPVDPIQGSFLLQAGVFLVVMLAVLYVAKAIILPVVLAVVLKLLLNPALRFLERWSVPRVVAALLLLMTVTAFIVGLVAALTAPAGDWFAKLPSAIPRMQERLEFLSEPVEILRRFLHAARSLTQIDAAMVTIPAAEGSLPEQLFAGTWNFAAGLFTTGLLLFFLLISGDTFLRKLVEVLPRFGDKRRAVEISQQIESDISGYLLTITAMNLLVGLATGFVMWFCGVGDPVLWGVVAFLLNYVPILGPLLGVGLFFFVGFLTLDGLWEAMLPASLYLAIHLAEGEGITPMLLARRFTLNPVLVILALVFWYWMWGVPGAILAVPIMAVTKIVCDRVGPLNPFGHFLSG
ncbi:MAG: AI-2E family transporter [Rhodospirillaceae bacterium]|nr:AI-2E family transporter [Rhodospirillaceae bacterium]